MELPKRKPTRLKGYDYSAPGAYFITICTHNRKCILGNIVGEGLCALPQNQLTRIGKEVEKTIMYINENYKEKIRLSELCFLFGTNKTTLCNHFRSYTGETIIEYVSKLRIKKAKKLMRSGNYNLTEISAIVGFSSVHYFSRIFKQYEKKINQLHIKSRLMRHSISLDFIVLI